MTNWSAYKQRFETHRAELQALMETEAARHGATVEEYNGDDSGFSFLVERPDGDSLMIQVALNDSGDADDGIYGVHGNFIIRGTDKDANPVISFGPENYTDDCWADYGDDDAWADKMDTLRRSFGELSNAIEQWVEKAAPTSGMRR